MDNALVLNFLRQLAANNNTAWMQAHRADYQLARAAGPRISGPHPDPGTISAA